MPSVSAQPRPTSSETSRYGVRRSQGDKPFLQYRFPAYAAPQIVFEPNSLSVFACNAALLQMYACKAIAYDGVVWSLSIEFSFYIMVYLARRLPDRVFIALAMASLAVFCLPSDLSDSAGFHLLMRINAAKYLWAFLFGYLLFRRHTIRELVGLGAVDFHRELTL